MAKSHFLAVRLLQEDRELRSTDPMASLTFDLDDDGICNDECTSITVRDVLAMCRSEFDIKNITIAFPEDVMVPPPVHVTCDYVVGPGCCHWSKKKQQQTKKSIKCSYEFRNESILTMSYRFGMMNETDSGTKRNSRKTTKKAVPPRQHPVAKRSLELFLTTPSTVLDDINKNNYGDSIKATMKMLDWKLNSYHTMKGIYVVGLQDITSIFVTLDGKEKEFVILASEMNRTFLKRKFQDDSSKTTSKVTFLKEYPTVKELKRKICDAFELLPDQIFFTLESKSDKKQSSFQIEKAPDNELIHNLGLSGPTLFLSLALNNDIQITLKVLTGKRIPIKTKLVCTVYELQQIVEEVEGIPINQSHLIFGCLSLEKYNMPLGHYPIEDGSVIMVVLKLRGGMFHKTSAKRDYKDHSSAEEDEEDDDEGENDECSDVLTHVKVLFPSGEEGVIPCSCGDKISVLKEHAKKLYFSSRDDNKGSVVAATQRRNIAPINRSAASSNNQNMNKRKLSEEMERHDDDDETEDDDDKKMASSHWQLPQSESHRRRSRNDGTATIVADMLLSPKEKILIKMLKRESQLRKCEDVQKRIELAERSVDQDWMDVIEDVQCQVVKEFMQTNRRGMNDPTTISIYELRQAALRHPEIAFWVKYNRARKGDLREGDKAPDVVLHDLCTGTTKTLLSGLLPAAEDEKKPCVVFAGSLSWPPFRYLAPFLARMSNSQKGQKVATWKMIYIAEAHAMNEWPIRSGRYSSDDNDGRPILVERQPTTTAERSQVAQDFMSKFSDVENAFKNGHMEILIDDPQQGEPFEKMYAPWPLRLYLIEPNGTISWIAAPKNCSFDEAIFELMQRLELW